jgi:hypothetical protein
MIPRQQRGNLGMTARRYGPQPGSHITLIHALGMQGQAALDRQIVGKPSHPTL